LVIVYIVTRLSRLTYDLNFWTQVQIIKVFFCIFFFCTVLFFLPFNVALRYSVYLYINQYNLEVMSHLWVWPQKSHNCFQAYLRAFSRSISSFFTYRSWLEKVGYHKKLPLLTAWKIFQSHFLIFYTYFWQIKHISMFKLEFKVLE